MSFFQILFDLLFIFIFPVMIGIAYWIFHFLIQRLPSYQRETLMQFSQLAVWSVLYEFPDASNKENLAKAKLVGLFGAFHLPVPSVLVLDIAIKARFAEMK
jgi:hypothetical protein